MNDLITEDLLDQTAKILRLLNRNNAHLVLIGRTGDRQLDSIYIAASMQQAKVYTLKGDNTYNLAGFQSDLRMVTQQKKKKNNIKCHRKCIENQ